MNQGEARQQGGAPPSVVRLEQSTLLPHDADAVWSLIAPAESAVLLTPETVARAFTVPGTPAGVGEQQCFLGHDGTATVVEVVERVEGRRAVARLITPATVGQRLTYDVEPLSTGCRLTYGIEVSVSAGAVLSQSSSQEFAQHAQRYLDRVRTVLDERAGPDPWDVQLDETFVAAATVREQPGHIRAVAARRITADHARAQPWRSESHQPPTTTRRRSCFLALPLALAAAGLAVFGTGHALERTPASAFLAGGTAAGDGTPRLPRPDDAQDQRLLPPVAPPAGDGGWLALHAHRDRPVGFDPCRPVHWVLADPAPPDALPLATEAFARLSEATGLVFVHDGTTDEAYDPDRPLVQSARYGERYAPVLLAWSDAGQAAELDGPIGGFAGPHAADPDGAGPRYVTGVVVLDGPDLQALPGGRSAQLGVLLHELGHLAGLDHVADPTDSMHASSDPTSGYSPGALRGLAAVGSGPCFLE